MKYHIFPTLALVIAFGLLAASGCAPSTSATSSNSFFNGNAKYSANVSELYQLVPFGTTNGWSGIDLKWKDSASGIIRALSGDTGKVLVLTFWVTRPDTGAWEMPTLDSVQSDLGDSVRIVTVAEDDNYPDNFAGVYNYVVANHLHTQIIVDTTEFAHIQYAEQVNPDLGLPETFVIGPHGYTTNPTYFLGYLSARMLDSLVRVAYR